MQHTAKTLILWLFCSFVIASCGKKEDAQPIPVADFSVTVSGLSPSATLSISNKSTNATAYSWSFGTGSSINTSTDKEPLNVKVEKAGDLSITLTATNGSSTSSKTIKVPIGGNTAIVTYTDIELSRTAGSDTYGRYFSFEDGKIYKDSEINATTGAKIHLAFMAFDGGLTYHFGSPTEANFSVPNATATKVTNWLANPPISLTDFDAMVDDAKLSGLTITDAVDATSQTPNTILFQIASGRKGVVKAKSLNALRMLMDIKIQKY